MSEIVPDTMESPPQPTVPVPPPRRKSRWWGILLLLLLLLLAASGTAAWLLWQQLQAGHALAQRQVDASETQLGQVRELLTALQQQVDAERGRSDQLQEQQRNLQAALSRLYAVQRRPGDKDDWSLAEVLYLLSVAQQRLSLAQDSAAALAALRAADSRLSESPDPRYLAAREQLARDIDALRSLARPDLAGIALRLNQYLTKAEHLPLLQGRQQPPGVENAEDEPAAPEAEGWRGALGAVWGELRRLVVIRYNRGADSALLAPEQRYLLGQNLRLKLEIARFFLLRQDTAQFRTAAREASDWLGRYYDQTDASVAAMRDDLRQMLEQELAPPLPDISRSLLMLQQLARESAELPAGDETP